MAFADHFSAASAEYARARPTYPDALFAFVAGAAPARDAAWDCATGSGQAAVGLAAHFARVAATDASAEQIANAARHPRVAYSVSPAERTGFPDAAFDAVCVAQAAHWFDLERFYAEVKRVLRPRGVVAVVGYDWARVSRPVDFALERHLLARIKPYWPRETAVLQSGYRDLAFPFEPIEAPPLAIEMSWTARQYLDYVETWTATRRYVAEHGRGALEETAAALERAWGGEGARCVRMPLHVRCGRHVA